MTMVNSRDERRLLRLLSLSLVLAAATRSCFFGCVAFTSHVPITTPAVGSSSSSVAPRPYSCWHQRRRRKSRKTALTPATCGGGCPWSCPPLLSSSGSDDGTTPNDGSDLDPDRRAARLRDLFESSTVLSDEVRSRLEEFSRLVCEWNSKINLVSRKDCTPEVVMDRHILPSIAPLLLPCGLVSRQGEEVEDARSGATSGGIVRSLLNKEQQQRRLNVIDVGTGGGFPGLPLAIACSPEAAEFVLLDSVGKKLVAVQAMADELGLDNVRTHHGRAEDFAEQKFDVATGRSVASIPDFCAVMQHLLKKDDGHLLYWTGGTIDEWVLRQATDDLVISEDDDDVKRVLTFSQSEVAKLASQSRLKFRDRRGVAAGNKKRPERRKRSRGEWKRKVSDDEEQSEPRSYDKFRRYSSSLKGPVDR